MRSFSILGKWITKRGIWGFTVVVGITLLVLISGVGVTMAATGVFSAKKSADSTPTSAPLSPSATPVNTSKTNPNSDIKQSVQNGSSDAGQNFVRYGEGFNVISGPSGIQFSYLGPCLQIGGLSVVTNNGKTVTTSPGCTRINPKGLSGATMFNWDGNFSNFCHSAAAGSRIFGGATAVRAEIFGLVSQWVDIPQNYLVCPGGSEPVPVPPAAPVAPEPVAPVETEVAPTSDPSLLPVP